MALNKSKQAQVDHRRQVVASLRLRGATIREIQEKLPKLGIINYKTGKPYTIKAVFTDINHLEKEWKQKAARDIDELISGELAEIREARRVAWSKSDLGMVAKFIDQEMKLLGTPSPTRHELTGAGGGDIQINVTLTE